MPHGYVNNWMEIEKNTGWMFGVETKRQRSKMAKHILNWDQIGFSF